MNLVTDFLVSGQLAQSCRVDRRLINSDINAAIVRSDPALSNPTVVTPDGAKLFMSHMYFSSSFGIAADPGVEADSPRR